MNKHRSSAMKTRQKLIDSFWLLYEQKRIDKITVLEITTLAGCNRCTFYEYFQDVHAVLEYIEDSLIPEIDELPPFDVMSDTPMDAFFDICSHRYYRVLLSEHGDPAFAEKLKSRLKQKLIKHLAAADGVALDYSLEFILSAMIGVLSYWLKQEENISKEKLISLVYKLMKNGAYNEVLK